MIKPHAVGDLSSASAHYDSIRGRVASSWKLKDGEFRLDVTIPANCSATIHVPAMDPSAIRESGCPLADATGVELRMFESGRAVIAVGSGEYSFVISAP